MRVLIAAGGSGGHLFPALAVISELKKNSANEVFFLTSDRGQEESLLKKHAIKGKLLSMIGMPRGLKGAWFTFFKKLLEAYAATKEVFNEFAPEIVLGHGGYVTFPVIYLAWKRRIPFCLQEQNVIPGLVNRLFLKKAVRIFSNNLGKKLPQVIDCGNPVRENLWQAEKSAALRHFGLSPRKFTLLILGGSQGAKKINRVFLKAWAELSKNKTIQVIWSTGLANYEDLKQMINDADDLKILPFIEEMGYAYMAADLVISRAGATAISEINACGCPSILIPYPYATHNHQYANAGLQTAREAAVLIAERDLTEESLNGKIMELIENKEKLRIMAVNSLRLGKREAAVIIVKELAKVIEERRENS